MYPELEEYLDDQGKLTAECLKALYGLIESGKLCTEQDWTKLERLLNYVNATKEVPLTLEMDDGTLES
eukprot:gene61893-biopygen32029